MGLLVCALAGARWSDSNLRARKGPPEPPPPPVQLERLGVDWRVVQITARDGITLNAWLLRPRSGGAECVLALHGLGGGRAGMLELAWLFLSHGYTVLMPDNRGLGESGGDIVTYGAREADDVHRWVDWLEANEHPRDVFGLGESLGGEVLVQSLAVESRFSAIVADSPFSELERVARERLEKRIRPPLLGKAAAAFIVGSGFVYARLRYGVDLRAASGLRAIRETKTPVLLIHGSDDQRTSAANSRTLAAENPAVVTVWLVPGAGHAALAAEPDRFRRRVLAWFADHARSSAR